MQRTHAFTILNRAGPARTHYLLYRGGAQLTRATWNVCLSLAALYATANLHGLLQRGVVLSFVVRTTRTSGRLAAPGEGILSLSFAKGPLLHDSRPVSAFLYSLVEHPAKGSVPCPRFPLPAFGGLISLSASVLLFLPRRSVAASDGDTGDDRACDARAGFSWAAGKLARLQRKTRHIPVSLPGPFRGCFPVSPGPGV